MVIVRLAKSSSLNQTREEVTVDIVSLVLAEDDSVFNNDFLIKLVCPFWCGYDTSKNIEPLVKK